MTRGVGHRLTLAEQESAVELYAEGASSAKLGSMFGVSGAAILQMLRGRGITPRNARECHRTCELDETVFDSITRESAYWIGVLFADGYMNPSSKALEFRIQARDRAHVEKLQAFLKSTHAVRTNKKGTSVGLSIRSPKLYDVLGGYGVVTRKSLTASVSPVLAHNVDFWRGVIDGDGCLKNYGKCPRVHLIGSEATIQQFATFCAPYLDGYPLKIRICKHSPIWNAMMHGNASMTMMRVLYEDAPVYLDRKKAFADEMAVLYTGRVFRTLKKFVRPSQSSA